MDSMLVVNSGSSSIKFQIFEIKGPNDLVRLMKGQLDGIGAQARLRVHASDGTTVADHAFGPNEVPDLPAALSQAGAWLRDTQGLKPDAIGHRVVHGGPEHDRPVRVNAAVLAGLERYIPLAPLHQPYNLAPIKSLLASQPHILQVACFDTAFHREHGPIADHYALPERFYDEGVRRYGFHGLSYEFVAERLRQFAPDAAKGRVIVAHLGSGSSMCAMLNSRSVDSTMGFTALDGLPMGTRPGQLDPGVMLYLIRQKKIPPEVVEDLLYRESGLKGLSGVSNDMRELEASDDPRAAFAIEYFTHRIGLHAGMLAAALGGLDAFVFTAGIGENSSIVRERVAERLAWLGVSLNPAANTERGATLISSRDSRIALYVIPTDEELMIGRHTLDLLTARAS
jgi:acetate kinase